MNTVFPVEVAFLAENGDPGGRLQGFTRNISAGGICVELKSFGKEAEKHLAAQALLRLTINPTFSKHPIEAIGRVAWLQKNELPDSEQYLFGVAYTEIDPQACGRLIGHARWRLWLPRLVTLGAAALIGALALLLGHSGRLVSENRRLVDELVETATKKSGIASSLYELQKQQVALDGELSRARRRVKDLESSLATMAAENVQQKSEYESELRSVQDRQKSLGDQMAQIRTDRQKLESAYRTIESGSAAAGPQAASRQMREWLLTHRNVRTGLVASYEGDSQLEDWAFSYDQALACQVFLISGEIDKAAQILDFYDSRAPHSDDGALYNAYDAADGSAKENVVHVGPNVWVGLAAIQYERKVQDGRFLGLARQIGDWVLKLQDTEGGIKGGPSVIWYSTEHNLDAYAFFNLLYERTRDDKYRQAAERSLAWIKKYAYSMKERRMHRGKGDATIATDTFSWAVAAIGPAKLYEVGLDPEAIMEFAEKNCEVSVTMRRKDGKLVNIKGFDFAKAQNVGRGGVISTEWTAQVIVTYRVLARYFLGTGDAEKAELYRRKADFYQNELQKLIITSPSRTGQGRGCLPYASADNVDTGHGWRTPKGSSTGSVAGTAYALFAQAGYNPFEFQDLSRSQS